MMVVRVSDEDTSGDDAAPQYQVSMQSLITVHDGDTPRQYTVRHEIARFVSGAWRVRANRDGKETEMRGDGAVPAMIDAGGAVVIFVAVDGRAPSTPPSAPTSI